MSREVVGRIGRIGLLVVALVLCAGAGWGVGRAGAPSTPVAVPDAPVGHVH